MTKILLVAPQAESEVVGWLDRTARNVAHQKAYVVPLHLATIAALTPDHHQVTIWDETVQGPAEQMLDAGFDLVGLTGYSTEFDRALAIADSFRARGVAVVIGGAGATATPDTAADHADAVFVGEAEATWPRFLAEFATGTHARLYQGDGKADMATSPPPRWDSIAHLLADNYKTGAVQTNRGCPHDCEFCNVWIQFGRDIRTKPVDQVLAEIATLERLGMKRVIFSTDNFIGNPKHAKEILRALVPLNRSFAHPLAFTAEITMIAARDDEMMALLGQANFTGVFIGIESTSPDSLKETRKRQNMKGDLVAQVRKIQSHGLAVVGSMIVGFDHDGADVFDQQFQFLQEACIAVPRLNILRAYAGTDLYGRMCRDGRVVDLGRSFPHDPLAGQPMRTNMTFKTMSRAQVYDGYLGLAERVWNWTNFRDRIVGFVDNLTNIADRRPDPRLIQVAENLRQVMAGLPGADQAVIDAVYAHTRARAPAMLWNVASQLMMQCYESHRLTTTRPLLREQIWLERQAERDGLVMVAATGDAKARRA